jgi:hypothetical protein
MCFKYGINGGKENAYTVWWGNLKEGDHLQYRLRYIDNIKIDLEERNRVEDSMGWINLDKQSDIWQSLANTTLEHRVP